MPKILTSDKRLTIRAGMSVDEVKNSKESSAQQKMCAQAFDADGNNVFSAREALFFNNTSISYRGKNDISFWTRFANGCKYETKINKDINSYKFTKDQIDRYSEHSNSIKENNGLCIGEYIKRELNLKEADLVDREPDYLHINIRNTMISMDWKLEEGAKKGQDEYIKYADIDNNKKIDAFEVIQYNMNLIYDNYNTNLSYKDKPAYKSAEEIYNRSLAAFKYILVNFANDTCNDESTREKYIAEVRKYEQIQKDPNMFADYIENAEHKQEMGKKANRYHILQRYNQSSRADIVEEKHTPKKYNGVLQVNMTLEQAKLKKAEGNFKLADLDGDDILSEHECSIWYNPVIEFSFAKKKHMSGSKDVSFDVSHYIPSYLHTFFYAGLHFEDIEVPRLLGVRDTGRHRSSKAEVYSASNYEDTEKYLIENFQMVDKNRDNELSQEEINYAIKNGTYIEKSNSRLKDLYAHPYSYGYRGKMNAILEHRNNSFF